MAFIIENGVLIKYYYESDGTEVVIPDEVTSIGEEAFRNCSIFLESVVIPGSVVSIGKRAFDSCRQLKSVTISDGVTIIGERAFFGCSNLESITIPESVTLIGTDAFANCYSLKSLVIPDSVKEIGSQAFRKCCDLESISIPLELFTDVYYALMWCDSLTEITIREDSQAFTVNWDKDDKSALYSVFMIICGNDFSVKCNVRVKYPLAVDFMNFYNDEDAKAYIKKRFFKIVKQLIDHDDVKRITALINKTEFFNKKNIDKIIDYAIEHTQKGGSIEPQVILMHYKEEQFGYKEKIQKLKL